MGRKSIYESFMRIQLEAIVISVLSLAMTIGCVVWCYKKFNERTSVTYIHNHGVTLQVFDDTENQEAILK
ncbi:hypothetical protein GCM10007390_46850 [Persicitalea jodogahamensis]|uniref:Uncharacterized protein n=1 Tax=Persicitalea jodogahamensis TaxID=402147 RepID=A0A8J3D7V6_9BACT|nr:hypothetical protein GCM10007390_46850 [Persicitalea jodogahamensis]